LIDPRGKKGPHFMVVVWRLVQLAVQAYLLCLVPLTFFQRSLIYQPTRCDRLPADRANASNLVVDVVVKSVDGLDLNGWLQIAGSWRGAMDVDARSLLARGGPLVLYFPGNAGMRSYRTVQLAELGSLDAHVLIMDYRGYADNPGRPSEAAFARDARSVWNYLIEELGVSPNRVVIYGESLGGGVATRLASDLCTAGIEPGGLIVQSTFNSLVAVAQKHFPVIPVSLLLADRYPSEQRIAKVTCPILQIHGKRDTIVPFELGQRLFDAAPAQSSSGVAKRQLVMPRTDHNDVYDFVIDPELVEGLRDFLDLVRGQVAVRSAEGRADSGSEMRPMNMAVLPVRDVGRTINLDGSVVIPILLLAVVSAVWWFGRRKIGE